MALSEARKRANKKWNDANLTVRYDRISLMVPKGRKAQLQEYCKQNGTSVNAFINDLINEKIKEK